jgi:ethanolamine utilization protein EutN
VILGRVSGTVVSTVNHPYYDGRTLLLVDRIGPDGEPTGDYLIAVDSVQAGAGETVLVLDEGNGGRQVTRDPKGPVRAVIVGIVDDVQVSG